MSGCVREETSTWLNLVLVLVMGLTHHVCKHQAQNVLCSEKSWEIPLRGWRFEGCSFLRLGAVFLLLAFLAQSPALTLMSQPPHQ